jgi:hypothetical protein
MSNNSVFDLNVQSLCLAHAAPTIHLKEKKAEWKKEHNRYINTGNGIWFRTFRPIFFRKTS